MKKTITEPYKGYSGVEYILEYSDADSFDHLDYDLRRQVYGVCFCKDEMVIGYGKKKTIGVSLVGLLKKGKHLNKPSKGKFRRNQIWKC